MARLRPSPFPAIPTWAIALRISLAKSEQARAAIQADRPHPVPDSIRKDRELVEMAAELLRRGRLSRFQFEGPTVAGLRVGLITERGYGWHDANAGALYTVRKALEQIGAVRPTRDQADRQAVVVREDCRRCGRDLDLNSGETFRHSFCSRHCLDVWELRNEMKFYAVERAAYQAAVQVARHDRAPPKPCARTGCTKPVRQWNRTQRYCSPECRWADQVVERPICAAEGCNERTRTTANKYCSPECAGVAKKNRPDVKCANPPCGRYFTPKHKKHTKFCSPSCYWEAMKKKAA